MLRRKQKCKGYVMCPHITEETLTRLFLLEWQFCQYVIFDLRSSYFTLHNCGASWRKFSRISHNIQWLSKTKFSQNISFNLDAAQTIVKKEIHGHSLLTLSFLEELIQYLCMLEIVCFRILEEYQFSNQQMNLNWINSINADIRCTNP